MVAKPDNVITSLLTPVIAKLAAEITALPVYSRLPEMLRFAGLIVTGEYVTSSDGNW